MRHVVEIENGGTAQARKAALHFLACRTEFDET